MIRYFSKKASNMLIKYKNFWECSRRRKKLDNPDFTILSNNCWGGFIYQMFGLQYSSPTIGLFIMERDYLKFVSELKHYLRQSLCFIQPQQSRYYSQLIGPNAASIHYPVARLGDIEIFFMHYHSEEEARQKWERRCQRINFDHLIVKMSQRSDCGDDEVAQFAALPYANKVCFTEKKYKYPCCVYVDGLKQLNESSGGDETDLTLKAFDITRFLNRGK